MSLKIGIIGLPNVGKSTLFNAIMGRQAALTAPYPFATVQPNVGVVDVPDERLDKLHAALSANSRSDVTPQTPIVRSSITFVDIAGLVKGAAEGHGLGNQFLSHIREADVILHVLRDFDPSEDSGQAVPRAEDSKNPDHDADIVETELALKDMESQEKAAKKSQQSQEIVHLLMSKPMIYAMNIDENKLRNLSSQETDFRGKKALYFCAKIEEQIAALPNNEQKEYLQMYGLQRSGLDRIITECFSLLGLISFFTAGKIEVRAWPIKNGSTAPRAAAAIHSDFEKLFIRAEVIGWTKMVEAGSWPAAKEKGWVRTEGREYVMKDGDVCNFLIGK